MNFYQWFVCIVGILYGYLTLIACVTQIYKKTISSLANTIMFFGGTLVLVSVLSILMSFSYTLILMVVGLILIHISAIMNGLHLHKKLNLSHHLVRLMISILLIVFVILS